MEVGIIGGILISCATSLNYFLFGKITNAYKPFDDVYNKKDGDKESGIAFVGGLMSVPYLVIMIFDDYTLWYKDVSMYAGWLGVYSIWQIIVYTCSGILVGAGATMMDGGFLYHGICAAPKFSIPSLITALLTIGSAILFVSLRDIIGLHISSTAHSWELLNDILAIAALVIFVLFIIATVYFLITKDNKTQIFFSFCVGAFLGLALLSSGLLNPNLNLYFLNFTYWGDGNMVVAFSILIAAGLNIVLYMVSDALGAPKMGSKDDVQEHGALTVQTILGAICYGCGWGWCGLNLASGLASMLIYPAFALWIGGVFLGIWLFNYLQDKMGNSDLKKPLIAA